MYDWIEQTLGVGDGLARILAFAVSLTVVLLLFALFVIILKRLMGTNLTGPRNRQPRIQIMDAATIDPRRRLVLVRRDNVEHLILIGGTNDVVVEQSIVRNAPLSSPHPRNSAGMATGPGPLPFAQQETGEADVTAPPRQEPVLPEKVEEAIKSAAMEETTPSKLASEVEKSSQFTMRPKQRDGNPEADLVRSAASGLFAARKTETVEPAKAEPVASSPQTDRKMPETASERSTAFRDRIAQRTSSFAHQPPAKRATDPKPDAPTEPAAVDSELFEPAPATPPKPNLASSMAQRPLPGFSPRKQGLDTRSEATSNLQTAPKITPPASGPAARAKTAIINSGPPIVGSATEPKVETAVSVSAPIKNDGFSKSTVAPAVATASGAASSTGLTQNSAPAISTVSEENENSAPPVISSTKAADVTPANVTTPSEYKAEDRTPSPASDKPEAETAKDSTEAAPSAEDKDLAKDAAATETDKETATDDTLSEQVETGTEVQSQTSEEKQKSDDQLSSQENQEAKSKPDETSLGKQDEKPASAVPSNVSQLKPVVLKNVQTNTSSAVHGTPTDINPIEAEMEKLLDEINGPRSL